MTRVQNTNTVIFQVSPAETGKIRDFISTLLPDYAKSPDFLVINEQDKQSIGIQQIKQLISWIKLKPFQSILKIGVIENADLMSKEAQNSLLKTLEELSANSYIFLIAKNYKSLLPTIRSRCTLNIIHQGKQEIDSKKFEVIANSSIEQKAKLIDEITKIKEPVEKKDKIRSLILASYSYALSSRDKSKRLQRLLLIEKTQKALKSNVNTKLLLDNFLFNFD